jgi:hypothetical protein
MRADSMTTHSDDSPDALAALYAAERSEVQSILGHALTLVNVLIGYSSVVLIAWATRAETIPHYLIPLIPVPAYIVIAWHSQLNSRVWAHNQVILVLEQRLLDLIPSIKHPTRLWIGHTSGRMVVELPVLVKERRFGMAAASIMTYGGVLAVVLALTISSISVPIVVNEDWQALASVMAVVYVVALVLLYTSYKSSFDISADNLDQWAKSAQQTFSAQFKTRHGYEEQP